jgi:putative DNA primase/helicase
VDNILPFTRAPAGDDEGEWTEDSVALDFAREHSGAFKYDHTRGRWLIWRGTSWRPDETGEVFERVRLHTRTLAPEADSKRRRSLERRAFIAAVENLARTDRVFATTADQFDRDPFLLGTPGGTVSLTTGDLRPARPADAITRETAVAPAETADCPAWLSFLDEATAGDGELIRFLQQWAGYCLTGTTREHALLFIYGPGGNGKSVLLEGLSHALGDYAVTAPMDALTASIGDRHPTDLAMLQGARLVSASETEEGRAWAESRIKQLTGGDTITARFMKQDFFSYVPQFKLTVVGNHKPALRNVDEAARRRFNIVPFTVKPARPDPELPARLRAEAPGILRWAIDGCLDWQAHGLVRPRVVREATAEYFEAQDLVSQWLEECCRVEPGNEYLTATPTELFSSWSQFATAAGERPGTQKALADALNKRGLTNGRRWHGGKAARLWFGIEVDRPEVRAWQAHTD